MYTSGSHHWWVLEQSSSPQRWAETFALPQASCAAHGFGVQCSLSLSPSHGVTPHCSTGRARAAGRKEDPRQFASIIFKEAFIFHMADADLLRQHFPQKHTGSYWICFGCWFPGSSHNFQPKSEISSRELKPEFPPPIRALQQLNQYLSAVWTKAKLLMRHLPRRMNHEGAAIWWARVPGIHLLLICA